MLNHERCCGHDLFWAGDQKGFARLAKESYEEIKDHGVEEIITSCPECLYTFKEIFPKVLPDFDLRATHIYESIDKGLNSGEYLLWNICMGRLWGTFQEDTDKTAERDHSYGKSAISEFLSQMPDTPAMYYK